MGLLGLHGLYGLQGLMYGVPTVSFDPALCTFTPRMAKRTAPGPFAAAPIVQGKATTDGEADLVTFGRGTQVVGSFYPVKDANQGSVVFWVTPEWDSGDGYTHTLFDDGTTFQIYVSGTTSEIKVYSWGSAAILCSADISSWVAGGIYCVVYRWDCDNKLDGANYSCLSINDVHTFGRTTAITPGTPSATQVFGGRFALTGGNRKCSNAIIEGLTVYRRPLYDGANGVDAGNGDEINLIWAAGAGKKPEEVTGAEDICFQLPTNGTAEELVTGTGEAWSFPWSNNSLLNWHLQSETGGVADNWTAVNAPTLADAATADILFDTRSQKISVDAADEGIKQAFAVSAGEDYYLSAWVKTGGANQGVDVRVYDATGAADVVELTTDSSSWILLETCFEVPAGCNSIEVYIESTDADTYDMHVGQVQVLPNLVDNGGMEGTYVDESGGGGGTIDVAPEWANSGCETGGTDTLDESADEHSGAKAQIINVDATDEGIVTDANCFTANKWHLVTVWAKRTAGNLQVVDGAGAFLSESFTPGASYSRHSFVTYATSATTLKVLSSGGAANILVDDVSVIELDDVSLTVTPASEANSTEDGGLRVDGRDTCVQDITGVLGATNGKIKFKWTLRHGDGDFNKFTERSVQTGDLTIVEIYKDNDNRILFIQDDNTTIKIICISGGVSGQNTWNAVGIVAGTTYQVEIEYNSINCTLKIDGVIKITATPASINFAGNIPDTLYVGSANYSQMQVDAVFSAP